MSEIEKSNLELYPEAALAALDALEIALKASAGGKAVSIMKALHLVPDRYAIFAGTYEGQEAVFRLPLAPNLIEEQSAQWSEMERAWAHMSAPPLSVAKPLGFDASTGLIIMAKAKGKGLLTALWSEQPKARSALIARSAAWLYKFTAPSIEPRAPNRRPWLRWAEAAAEKQPHEALAKLEARTLQKMKKLYRQIDLPEWRVALTHGDFHLNNLLYDGTNLTGIDLGATNHAPLYKDIARALVHMARRGMIPSGARRFGVDEAALLAYVETFSLSEEEANGFLPFFIAFETLIKVEHPKMPQARLNHAAEMTEALNKDLKKLTSRD